MGCATPAVPWQAPLTEAHNLRCEAHTQCEKKHAEVVSCGDPAAGHEWQAQRSPAIAADCVAPAQQQDLPKQVLCPQVSSSQKHWGMEMVWQFFSRYSLLVPNDTDNPT